MKQRIRIIYLIVFLIFSSIGCGLSIYTYDDNLYFFTFLSNVFCWVLMAIELVKAIRRSPSGDAWVRLNFIASFCIMLTGLIYNILLGRPATTAYWHNYQSLILHVFVPITFVAYFFLFQPRGKVRRKDVWLCVLPPYLYIAEIFIRHAVMQDDWYPYFFLNVHEIGATAVVEWVAALTVAFLALGFMLGWCDWHRKPGNEK
jgi:hypothetical protein